MDVNETYCYYFIIIQIELHCITETSIILYINYTSTKQLKQTNIPTYTHNKTNTLSTER